MPERAVSRSLREQANTASTSSPARSAATVAGLSYGAIAPDDGRAAGRDSATVNRMQPLRWERRPDGLRAPALVCAFKGWNDAGEAATSALTFMGAGLDAARFAMIDPEEFVDFQSTRPTVRLTDGLSRRIDWPEFEFYEARVPRAPRDLVLLSGPEPAMRWRTFCEKVIELAEALGVQMVVTLGALLADVPHTRPVSITGMASDQGLIDRLGLQPPTYEGPTGIVGVLHAACADAGIPSASLWAAVPHYVAVAPNPKGALALLRRLESLVGVTVDATELESAAADYDRQVSRAVELDPEVQAFVERLERAADEEEESAGERPPPLGRRPRPRVPALPAPARLRRPAGRRGARASASSPPSSACSTRATSSRARRAVLGRGEQHRRLVERADQHVGERPRRLRGELPGVDRRLQHAPR